MIIFCADPLNPRDPDPLFEGEMTAAKAQGFDVALISYETLFNELNPARAVRTVEAQEMPKPGLYRGWMLKPEQYSSLYEALLNRGIRLINDPDAYKHCHHLPESYSVIQAYTPTSIWVKTGGDISIDVLMEQLHPFGSKPVIVKDYVKSQKHYWNEAAFIPSASDRNAVERVVGRFLELQGDDLNEGLVFREFVEFEPLTTHAKSGMPLTKEFRMFFLDGEPVYTIEYWEHGDYTGVTPTIDRFRDVAHAVQSRFFTMDIAKQLNGEWMIVELGDGQVAGLPERADTVKFYQALRQYWPAQ